MRARLMALRKGVAEMFPRKTYATRASDLECEPHMNELPVPCEPWDPWYQRQQRMYNLHLAGGLAWFLFSLGMALYTDAMHVELWFAPAQPGPPSDMVEECDDSDT